MDLTLRLKRGLDRALFAVSVLVIVSPALLVILWMLSLSLKTELENMEYPPVFLPATPTLPAAPCTSTVSPRLTFAVRCST